MQAITETLAQEGIAAPRSAQDMLALLQLYRIVVIQRAFEREQPMIELDFHAALEPEHGIGVLTDGRTVLGIGYSCGDVYPFDFDEETAKRKTLQRLGCGADESTSSLPKASRRSIWTWLFGGS